VTETDSQPPSAIGIYARSLLSEAQEHGLLAESDWHASGDGMHYLVDFHDGGGVRGYSAQEIVTRLGRSAQPKAAAVQQPLQAGVAYTGGNVGTSKLAIGIAAGIVLAVGVIAFAVWGAPRASDAVTTTDAERVQALVDKCEAKTGDWLTCELHLRSADDQYPTVTTWCSPPSARTPICLDNYLRKTDYEPAP
jgi:hypothetical protein